MPRPRAEAELPPCYAMVFPGLEEIAADEITRDLGGDVRKTARGLVVFRVPTLDPGLLKLRTTEDVFLLAWGTDQLTHRFVDLEKIEQWTANKTDWQHLLKLHHGIHPRPRGRPTYRLVTQKEGTHGYLRKHAGEALAKGLSRHLPQSWKYADENASVEVWLTIHASTAWCGLRLSTREMRHRTYKVEHIQASLRPTIAAAMVRIAGIGIGMTVVDPMCGAGTIVGEVMEVLRSRRGQNVLLLGGDIERHAVRAADVNLRRMPPNLLAAWDALHLPLASASVDRIISNPPFGKKLADPEEIGPLYKAMAAEYDRVLKPGGRAVLLTSESALLQKCVRAVGWTNLKRAEVRVLGQRAGIGVWKKPENASDEG